MTLGKFGEGLHALFSCCGFLYLPPGHFSDSSSSRSRTPDHGIIDEEQSESSNGSQISHFPDKWASLKVCYSDIEEATNGLNEALKIGKGGYGSVYKGKLGRNDVAIKILDSTSNQGQKEFFQELAVLHEMRHPNLVKLVGACLEARALVYEYLPHGSLEDFLKENPSLLTWKMRTRIIYEICSALIYLHSRSVVHGDLKPANILLDANFKSKLSDFGLCRFLPKDMTTSVYLETIPKGTSGYIDPWFLETWILRPGSDLYSFGITILKLLTGLPPVGLGIKARDTDENLFREMIDSTAGIWPFEMAKELLYWSLQCCYHNEYQKSSGLLKDMSTCLEDMLAEIESLQEGGFKVVMRGQRTVEAEDTNEEPEAEVIMVVKIHMHNATYAQEIKERILRMKETELESSLVLVNGAFDPSKLVEYAYRMTGKRPLIVKVLPVAEYDQRNEAVAKSVGWKTAELQRLSASDSVWITLDCPVELAELHRLSDRRTVTHTESAAEWVHTSASDSLENNHPLERCDSLDSSHRSSAADDDSDAVELDAKADGFIARFREQIRLQRIQSIHDDIVF